MRIPAIASAGLLACRLAAQGTGPVPEWEAVLPPHAGSQGPAGFFGALEAGNGDFLVAGSDAGAELLVRLDPAGEIRWAGRYPFRGGGTSAYLGMHETSRGIVSLWGCCGQLGGTAMLHGESGELAARADLNYAKGILDVSTSARVVFLSIDGAGPQRQQICAESRGFASQGVWKTVLADAAQHELIGIRAVGDGAVAVLDRMGGPAADTLKVTLLDSTGRVLWSRHVPTGAKLPDYPDNHAILWNAIAKGPENRIVLAGIVEDFSEEDMVPDSLAVVVLTTGGGFLGLRRIPLRHESDPVERGFWELLTLSAGAGGIRVGLFHQAGRRFWSEMEISWTGVVGNFLSRSPEIGDAGFNLATLTASGNYLGFGEVIVPGSMPPIPGLDSVWRATGLTAPAIFNPVGGKDGEWRPRAFSQYTDTVRGRISPTPVGPTLDFSVGPGLDFLLSTRDGGVLTGGRLWRRDDQDTLAVIAIKIPPGGVRVLRPRNRVPGRRPGPVSYPAAGVDAAGRLHGNPRGPLFFRSRYAPMSPQETR